MSTISRPQVVNFNESKTKIIGSKDSSYLVIDNFLSEFDHQVIKNTLLGDFPWYYIDYKVDQHSALLCEEKYNFQL